jgi:hypothetical protein
LTSIFTHGYSILSTIAAAFSMVLVGNQIADSAFRTMRAWASDAVPISAISVRRPAYRGGGFAGRRQVL